MGKVEEAKELANQAVVEERRLSEIEQEFALASPQFAKYLKAQKEVQTKIDKMWADVKASLIEAEYTDVLENDNFKISISKVPSYKVVDIEKVPEEYTEVVKQAKMDKIKQYIELYEKIPEGIADSSFYRLNKKIKG
jgi:hypothetical protein